MRFITICVGRLTLAAEPAHTQLSRFYHGSTCDMKHVMSHTRPSPSLCNNGRGLGMRLGETSMVLQPPDPEMSEISHTLTDTEYSYYYNKLTGHACNKWLRPVINLMGWGLSLW